MRATDAAGNTDPSGATATWAVDTTPPTITTPGALTVEANGPSGSVTTYTVTAADNGTALLPAAISCAPASGSLFPLGETLVSCEAADALGNIGSASFTITVQDTTAPTLNAGDATFVATSAAGIGRDAPPVAAYLRGFTASDLVGVVAIRTTAPELFPVGATKMLVTAVDAAGNQARRQVTVTVLPRGSEAPPPPDQKPPADVSRVRAVAGDHKVTLSWLTPSTDVSAVEIRVSAVGEAPPGRLVYRGLRSPQVITRLRNDVEHRFVLVTVDAAGNRSQGVVAQATPRALLLGLPKPGARVTVAPLLRWAPVGGASYFNVQVYRGRVKVLSVWPTKARYKLKARWVYEKVKRSLVPGTYTWYVWPGLGARAEARYGPLIGRSTFRYVKPKTSPAAKKAAAKKAAAKKAAAKKAAAKKAAAKASARSG
ncbi:MAG: HYR domain-containing protein [Thermoleophilia bacterium]|nr:HYR domain-containing protein [Thermoleophilia bacterium]MDH5334382.1 HYR domain-containing protein [Thermoleophilia bacterium]